MIAPNELTANLAISDKLIGLVRTIVVTPLRLDEIDESATSLSTAMGPLMAVEAAPVLEPVAVPEPLRHWVRGGFPESLEASTDQASLTWRRQFIAPLLERDYNRWGLPAAFPLHDFLRWLALRNSAELDESVSKFGKRSDLNSGLHVLERLGLIRRIPNIAALDHPQENLKDKFFVRDTGVLHAMLGVVTRDQLMVHKKRGPSFESYAIEALVAAAGIGCETHFYRFDNGQGEDEIDLILEFPSQGSCQIAVECKVNPTKKPEPGFVRACQLLGIEDRFVVHSGPDSHLDEKIHRLDMRSAIRRVTAIAAGP